MTRRQFIASSAAAASVPAEAGIPQTPAARAGARQIANMTIRDFLSEQAREITDRALAEYTHAAEFARLQAGRRKSYLDMMGLADLPEPENRPPLNVTVTGMVERQNYRMEKLHYQSLPGLYVTANLYIPKQLTGKAAGVLYVCGHAEQQKVHYQAHPRRFAELGFVSLLVETVQLGEARGYHHGCYREGWFHWYSRGYSPAAVEALNGIRGLDLLASRPEVDKTRLGVTGISGGGAVTWWIGAADTRVKVAAPVCGTSTLASYLYDRTIDGHCDCMWWPNLHGWDLADVGALVAPRPLLIASADRDGLFNITAIRRVHEQLSQLYGKVSAADRLKLVETPGPHSYHERSRTAIFSWFAKHLQNRDVAPDQVGDVDESPASQESEESLRVFVSGPPAANRALTIQDELIPLAATTVIRDRDELRKERARVVQALKATTFHAFPKSPPALNMQVEIRHAETGAGGRFAFTSERGWRLHGQFDYAKQGSALPAVLALRSPGEPRRATESLLSQMRVPWIKAVAEPRGTGDTAWGEELSWHVRRASAWTGRTIASMRVWDTLRALEAARGLEGVDNSHISLLAQGEMCAVALYAALLDSRVETLILIDPPATQNAPSNPDGRGPAIEMLGCLRITDLPQVAGLLFPTRIAIIGTLPATYQWAQALYTTLGAPASFIHADTLTALTW